jgi:hypothetical protein
MHAVPREAGEDPRDEDEVRVVPRSGQAVRQDRVRARRLSRVRVVPRSPRQALGLRVRDLPQAGRHLEVQPPLGRIVLQLPLGTREPLRQFVLQLPPSRPRLQERVCEPQRGLRQLLGMPFQARRPSSWPVHDLPPP